MIDAIVKSSEQAFQTWSTWSDTQKSDALQQVAGALEAAAEELITLADEETNLGVGRLTGELKRTVFQIRFFAENILTGDHLGVVIDTADPDWPMGAPRPDMRRIKVPLGPVAVFAASNFPFAFSVMGGDSVSALAAGCSVVVKAHSGHPQLSRRTAEIVTAALAAAGAPDNVFQIVYNTQDGVDLVQHPLIKAAGFTGSIGGGRALYNLAASRPEPIPFYGELGSVNPVLVTENGVDDPKAFAEQYISSLFMGSGQFCTKPGILLLPEGHAVLDILTDIELPSVHKLLNPRILSGYVGSLHDLSNLAGVKTLQSRSAEEQDYPSVNLLQTDAAYAIQNPRSIIVEVFGPTGLVITYQNQAELAELLKLVDGQLTFTIFADENDPGIDEAISQAVRIAGRLLWKQWPTGVSVTYSQQHGGPYPASTFSTTTSVGSAAIERFLRPVVYQGFPESVLPAALK